MQGKQYALLKCISLPCLVVSSDLSNKLTLAHKGVSALCRANKTPCFLIFFLLRHEDRRVEVKHIPSAQERVPHAGQAVRPIF